MKKKSTYLSGTFSAFGSVVFAGLLFLAGSTEVFATEVTQQVQVFASDSAGIGVVATMYSGLQTAPDGTSYLVSFDVTPQTTKSVVLDGASWGVQGDGEVVQFRASESDTAIISNINILSADSSVLVLSDVLSISFDSVYFVDANNAKDRILFRSASEDIEIGKRSSTPEGVSLLALATTSVIDSFLLTNNNGTETGDRWSVGYITVAITFTATEVGVITFDANGGSGTMTDQSIGAVGSAVTLDSTEFYRDGYYFYGWSTSVDGDTLYNDGASYTPVTESDTLYVVWKSIPEHAQVLMLSEFSYSIVDSSLTIRQYTGDGQDSTCLYIPDTYLIDGVEYTVTVIGTSASGTNAFKDDTTITYVILPSTLTKINKWAFLGCSLDSVSIPASVTYIDKAAFDSQGDGICLTKVVFEEGSLLDSLATGVFGNNDNLVSFTLPDNRVSSSVKWYQDDVELSDLEVLNASFGSSFNLVENIVSTSISSSQELSNTRLSIYPNPVKQTFSLNVETSLIQVYDAAGKFMKQYTKADNCFNISDLHRGIYFVKVVMDDESVVTQRIVKE
jgi:hypothetical protein